VDHGGGLGLRGLDHAGVAVAHVHHGNPGGKIEIAPAIRTNEVHAFGAGDGQVGPIAGQAGSQQVGHIFDQLGEGFGWGHGVSPG
jgi:hypothetical protein